MTRCTKKEINNVFKDVCKKVGVLKDFYLKDEEKQEIFFEIKAMMLIDQEACQEYDGTVVAYLLRHQAATELALTSASREAISVLMGHKIENPNVKSFDFSNIEGQRELRDILMRRPLYRYICNKMDVKEIKTKTMVAALDSLKVTGKTLIMLPEKNENVQKSARNIEGVKTTLINTINVYDLLKYNKLVVTLDTVKKLEEVYA